LSLNCRYCFLFATLYSREENGLHGEIGGIGEYARSCCETLRNVIIWIRHLHCLEWYVEGWDRSDYSTLLWLFEGNGEVNERGNDVNWGGQTLSSQMQTPTRVRSNCIVKGAYLARYSLRRVLLRRIEVIFSDLLPA
jgi:hypothetical protein